MRFGERVVVFILHPIYRTFFERLFWWFLLKVKAFMLADVQAQLASIQARLVADESRQRWAAMEERLGAMESANAAQWDALEQLLLALFRQPEHRGWEADSPVRERLETGFSAGDELKRAHAANNIR